jgi:hypothetical protein
MRRAALRATGVAAVLSGAAVLTVAAPAAADGVHRNISSSGTARFVSTPPGSSALQFPELRGGEEAEDAGERFDGEIVNRKQSRGRGPGGDGRGKGKARNNPELVTSFGGLTGLQQRTANRGKQFSVEPPDQGVCAGNGFVLESVNDVRGNPGFTVWPSTSPAQDFATGAGGTEYFMSSNAAEEANGDGTSRDLLVWSLTNTESLNTATPDLKLDVTVRRVGRYGLPPLSDQKPGDFPLGRCLNDTTLPTPTGAGCWRLIVLTSRSTMRSSRG